MKTKLEKILMISSYAPPAIGGPQMLYNILNNLPYESYCILTSFYNIDNFSLQKGSWLKGKYIFYDKPGTSKKIELKKIYASGKVKRDFVIKIKHLAKRSAVARVFVGLLFTMWQIVAILLVGKKAIIQEKIETLVGISDYGPSMIGTYILHKLTKKPFVVYFFDIYWGNFLPFPGNIVARILEPLLIKDSQNIVVTNQGTKEFYQRRYGDSIKNKLVVVYNSLDPAPYKNLLPEKRGSTIPYVILFTGRINWPQIGSIKNLIRAVESMDNVKIKFYCPNPRDYLEKIGIKAGEKIEIDVAAPDEIPAIERRADILFLPLSWHTKSQDIIDTATPGKLTNYLISGRPILIHAPVSSHLVHYAKEKQFAHIVDEENIEDLRKGIRALIQDKEYASRIVANARATFFENHDVNKNMKTFYDLF